MSQESEYFEDDPNNGKSSPPSSAPELFKMDLQHAELYLREKSFFSSLKNTLNLILIPLLVLAGLSIGFILVWAEHILVPFVISIFFSYLLKPIVDFLSDPFKNITFLKNLFINLNTRQTNPNEKHNFGFPLSFNYPNSPSRRPNRDNSLNQPIELTNLLPVDDNSGQQNTLCADDNNGKLKRTHHTRIGCPRIISVFLTMLFALTVLFGIIFFFVDAVQRFEENNWEKYENRAVEIATEILKFLKNTFGVDGSKVYDEIMKEIKVFEITTSLVILLMDAAGYCFIVFLFVLYILFEDGAVNATARPLGKAAYNSFDDYSNAGSSETSSKAQNLRMQVDVQIQRYIVIKTLISIVVGFLVYIVLGPMLDVKLAHVFGVVTVLANFIPSVGAIVATLLPLPLLILDPDQTNFSILCAIFLPVGIHMIVGNFVEPKIFGDTMELHAVVVLLSLSFWFAVWGIPGAILAVPIMAIFRIVLSNIKHPYAVVCLQLLEGKIPGGKVATD
eukprot:maker-scaffold_12-augustus-gene-5.76-mRNA-1 protein AED:0.00 eAED:0.00 QI:32/1/1/1/1/1/2/168/503